jgi:hypothetical protein
MVDQGGANAEKSLLAASQQSLADPPRPWVQTSYQCITACLLTGVVCGPWCAVSCCAGGRVGSTPLWHALIRYPQRHQHITLAYPQQLFPARSQVRTNEDMHGSGCDD